MIKNIEGKKLEVLIKEDLISLPEDLKIKINDHWKNAIKNSTGLWNGVIPTVTKCVENKESTILYCQNTNYAHFLYDERIGCPEDYKCYNLSAGTLLETLDEYYLVGVLASNMSLPGCLQIPGGSIDKKDIFNGIADSYATMRRETIEEVNIDIEKPSQVISFKIMYLMPPNDEANGYEILGKAKVNFTANELIKHYETYRKYLEENNLEIEFDKILLIKKDEAIEKIKKMNNPRRKYLIPLLEADIKK